MNNSYFRRFSMAVYGVLIFMLLINNPITHDLRSRIGQDVFNDRADIHKAKFCDVDSLELFEDRIYCLNDTWRMVLVLSEQGTIDKVIQLPGRTSRGMSRLYSMNGKLCILDVKDTLYQYDSYNSYHIIKKRGKNIYVYDEKGKVVEKKRMPGKYDAIFYYESNGRQAYYTYETEHLYLYSGDRLIKTRSVDDQVLLEKKRVQDNGTVYSIGRLGNSIMETKNGRKKVLYRSSIIDYCFNSFYLGILITLILVLAAGVEQFRSRRGKKKRRQ